METQIWIKELVERGYKRRAIILEGAKRYFGQNLSRVHCLDNNLFQIVFKKYGVDDKNGTIDVPVSIIIPPGELFMRCFRKKINIFIDC